MRRVSIVAALILVCALPLSAAPPALADISVGTNFGVAIHSPEDGGDNTTLVGVPSQASLIGTIRPGLRIGGAGSKRDHEGYLDLSYDGISSGGSSFHALRLGLNYQYNFGGGSFRPFLTIGGASTTSVGRASTPIARHSAGRWASACRSVTTTVDFGSKSASII